MEMHLHVLPRIGQYWVVPAGAVGVGLKVGTAVVMAVAAAPEDAGACLADEAVESTQKKAPTPQTER